MTIAAAVVVVEVIVVVVVAAVVVVAELVGIVLPQSTAASIWIGRVHEDSGAFGRDRELRPDRGS